MMFKNSFVVSLKVGGKILRETSGTVSLPFGSEYDILLKNLNSRRAMAKVTVDGQDATEGTRLILEPNATLTLERFIKNGNLKSGNRFKFIERTDQIEAYRGIKEDDGLIRVEFWAEKEVVDVPVVRKHYYDEWYPRPWYAYYPAYPTPWLQPTITWTSSLGDINSGGLYKSAQASLGNNVQSQGLLRSAGNQQMYAMNCAETSFPTNDAGITVAGSESRQQFQSVFGFNLESNSTVVVLQLRGVSGGKPVEAPVTVESRPSCSSCGKSNKPGNKFCSNCGTSLISY